MSRTKLWWKNNKLKRSKFLLIFLILFVSGIFFLRAVYAGTLSCSVTTAGACTGTVIWRMSGSANAHAELASQATAAYDNNVVCCSGVTGLGTSCATGATTTVLRLSGTSGTNAHAQQTGSYANDACISVPSGGSVSIAYQATNCSGYDTTLGSIEATTNAHVGNTTAYTTKVCGTAVGPAASLTLIVDTDSFPNLTPGTMVFATSTISVETDNSTGWYVELYGQDQGLTDTVLDLSTDASVGIADQSEWIPGTATTTAGNAVVRASLDSSGQVLAFRVMSASGSAPFLAPTWWGTTDADGTAAWAGIPSSTAANLKIGNSSVSSGGGAVLNTVQYYLDTPITQQTGTYDGNLIFTATMNP